jgi:threonine synthase
VAGLRRAVEAGVVGRRAIAVALITGNGLKDVQSARAAAGEPFEVSPEGSELEEILRQRKVIG